MFYTVDTHMTYIEHVSYLEVAMARAMTEKANPVYLANRTTSRVSGIGHLPFDKKATVKFPTRTITVSPAVANPSTCTRCGGLMVKELYMDVLDSLGESTLPPKRCVQCGEVVDFVILINRRREQQSMPLQSVREVSSLQRMSKGQ